MRINGVAEGVKRKKSLLKYAKSSMSYAWSQVVTCRKPSKNRYYWSFSIDFQKIKQNAFRSFDYLSNKKNHQNPSSGYWEMEWYMSRWTDTPTDRQRAWHDDFFQHVFSKILDFRSVRFAKRNISPLEDNMLDNRWPKYRSPSCVKHPVMWCPSLPSVS